jgi:hypothetical protein
VRGRVALLIAWLLGGPAPLFADPAYLPPFLDRAPAVGDRWVYEAKPRLPYFERGLQIVEVVEASDDAGGWRYVVEDHVEYPPPAPPEPRVVRTEWFLRADGSIWRGDAWVGGDLSIDLEKPLPVIRRLPDPGKRTRFAYLAPDGAKRHGSISGVLTGRYDPGTGSPASGTYAVRIARQPRSVAVHYEDGEGKTRPTLTAHYDPVLGRVGWDWNPNPSNGRSLISARIDGETYEP